MPAARLYVLVLAVAVTALFGEAACDQLNRPFNTTSSSSSGGERGPSDADAGADMGADAGAAPSFTPQPGDIQL